MQQIKPQQQQPFMPQQGLMKQAAQQQPGLVGREPSRAANAGQKFVSNSNLISESKECAMDVKRICPESMLGSNYYILTCLAQQKDDTGLSDECHTVSISLASRFGDLIESRFKFWNVLDWCRNLNES